MEPVGPDTPLACFITQGNQYGSKREPHVHFSLFMPRWFGPKNRLEHSTYRADGLAGEELKAVGDTHITPHLGQGRQLKGVTILSGQEYIRHRLSLDPDNDPPRHVSVIDWPEEEDAQVEIAMALSGAVDRTGRCELYR
jgi:hypothetical protein